MLFSKSPSRRTMRDKQRMLSSLVGVEWRWIISLGRLLPIWILSAGAQGCDGEKRAECVIAWVKRVLKGFSGKWMCRLF